MSPAHDSQLLKGLLGLVLLRLLAEGESYGYQLVARVHALGLADVPDGSIYPALGRLEREGYITSRLVPSSAGPARKYYRLSPSGHQALSDREEAWTSLVRMLEPLFSRRPESRRKEM